MPETATETVTLDRQAVVDLIVQATMAVDVLEVLLAGRPLFVQELDRTIDGVGAAAVGSSEYSEVWRLGEARAKSVVAELTAKAQSRLAELPPVMQLLAVNLLDRDPDELAEVGVDVS